MHIIRRFANEAMAQLAADVLAGQGIQAQVLGNNLGFMEAANTYDASVEVVIAEADREQAEAVLIDNGL